jgi:serine/threonine protein kinase
MQTERWHKIEWLFHAALARDPTDRLTFLADNCGGDAALFEEVTSLITSFEQTHSFFETTASPLVAQMFADQVGETIGPYKILSLLGSGGMGTVYLAQDLRLGRKIALKLLPPHFTNDKDRLRRFQQEARAASALNHPNILTVHEIEQKSDLHYIATEFVDGLTLRQKMAEAPINVRDAVNIATQIASALDAAHRAGITHRDIKPENVMLRSDGYVKVLDFGLAKLTDDSTFEWINEAESGTTTRPGIVMGTPRYMSPEQARGLDVDSRTDIFSLGVIMYEMLMGRVPFDGATPSDVIAALLKDDPAPMSVDPQFEQLVKRTLAKNPDDRYQTAAELFGDLNKLKQAIQTNDTWSDLSASESSSGTIGSEAATAGSRLGATDPETVQDTTSLEESRTRGKRRFGFIIAAVVVVLVGAMAIASLNRRGTAPASDPTGRSSGRALTIRSGYISAARFAPDGKTVIYSAAFDGRPLELFATDTIGSESRPLGIPSAALKDISATGEMAVLLNFELSWNEGRNGTLALVPSSGAEPRVLMDGIDEATFAPDGKSLAIIRAEMGQHQLEYPIGEVLFKSEGWMSYPRFSRMGDKIAFFEHPLGDNSGSVKLLDLSTKSIVTLSTGWRALKGLAWSANGNALWFGGSKLGKKQNINSVSLSGQERLNIDEMASYSKLEDISPQGRLLISHGNTHTTMVLLTDMPKSESLSNGARFAWSTSADISNDGKTLLFYEWGWEAANELQVKSTYIRKLDDPNPIRLGEGRALALSADGNWALAVQEKSPPQLVLLSTAPGKQKELPNPGFKEYHYGSWFPDGRRILFTAVEARQDASVRSYVQDVDTGVVRPLTEEGTEAVRISPDGKKVVILDPYGAYSVHFIDSEAADVPLSSLERTDEPIQWSADGQALYVRGGSDFAAKVYRVDIATGQRRVWRDILPSNPVGLSGIEAKPGGIAISSDGKVCVYTYWTTLHELLLMDHLA